MAVPSFKNRPSITVANDVTDHVSSIWEAQFQTIARLLPLSEQATMEA